MTKITRAWTEQNGRKKRYRMNWNAPLWRLLKGIGIWVGMGAIVYGLMVGMIIMGTPRG